MFVLLALFFAIAAIALFRERAVNPTTRPEPNPGEGSRGFIADYAVVLASPWARFLILAGLCEAMLVWGAFAYVGADMHLRFSLSFTLIGLIVGAFGIGGLIYAGMVKHLVLRFGQTGLARLGGVTIALAYLAIAFAPVWWIAPIAVVAIGLGFYMLHNTMQTNVTQVTPEARATAVALFSAALYIGQTIGVAVASLAIDRTGAPPIFIVSALLMPVLGFGFAAMLKRR